MSEDDEVAYWTKKFGVTKQQLQAVVDKTGVSVAAVEKELSRRGYRA
jgi:stage III sporulation protein SpoIIIAA